MNRFFQNLFASCALIFIVGVYVSAQQASIPSLPPESSPLSFRLRGIDRRTYDLNEMRGEVVLVSFGATWCLPCSAELVALEALKNEYANRPVRFFWVSTDREDISNGLLRNYARERRLTMPILRDPDQTTFMQFTNRPRIPMVVLFDKEGRFDDPAHFGMSTPDAYSRLMRRRIDALLQPTADANAQPGAAVRHN